MRKRALFFSLLLILTLLGFPFLTKGEVNDLFQKIGIQPIKGNRMAPNFRLEGLNGKKVELKNFKGKVIFLNFWATWCSPCKEEMPSMEVLYKQFKEKDFVLLGISVDYEGAKLVKEYIEKNGYTFPVLIDSKSKILDLYGIRGIPTTILIDKKGRMLGKAIGPRNWNSPEVMSLLNQLIEK